MDPPSQDHLDEGSVSTGRNRAPTITINQEPAMRSATDSSASDAGGAQQRPAPGSPLSSPTDSAGLLATNDLVVPANSNNRSVRHESLEPSHDSRPTSPPNVPNTVAPRSHERAQGFLAVPNTQRARQDSLNSAEDARSFTSSQGDTTTGLSAAGEKPNQSPTSTSTVAEQIMTDEDALKPDQGNEDDFEVEANPFAFSPGMLNKMFNPKSLAAFWKLGGLAGLEKGLRTDRKSGLSVEETRLDGAVSLEAATGRGQDKEAPGDGRVGSRAAASHHEDAPFAARKRVFKDNRLPEKKGKSLLQLMWITYNDKVLILLSIAAVVSLAIGLYQTFGQEHADGESPVEWVEGVAIIVAIVIVVVVGSLNDYQKERQFAKLNKKKQDRLVKAVRSGRTVELSVFDILVGDILHLEPGDLIPVDGVLVEGFNVKCDESQATGESDVIRKKPADEVMAAIENHGDVKKMDPFIQSGARVMEGAGTFLCTSTGIYSSYGKTLMSLNEDPEITPLQSKLNVIAEAIAKLGGAAGLILFLVLFILFCARLPNNTGSPAEKGQQFLNIFIVVVTIIVVAVPEGLPLAVTLALAFATTRMLKDNNLVRHLKACEVMGNASTICSDKTGTLTQNKMQVVAGTVGTKNRFGHVRSPDEKSATSDETVGAHECTSALAPAVRELLLKSISLNSTAFEGEFEGQMTFIGSKTETALLIFAKDHLAMGPVSEERCNAKTLQRIPFDSGRKCMGIVVQRHDGGARLYVKGASEMVLEKCSRVLVDPQEGLAASAMTADERETISGLIASYANKSLRTIGIIFRDLDQWPPRSARRVEGNKDEMVFEDLCKDMTFVGLVGIKDPLRAGVPEAVKLCQKAGVTVRMVTGDNKLTAQAIAKDCGILSQDSVIMEGPEFRNLSKSQQEEMIPRLHVLARSSPEDKRILVKRLKDKGETVAVTGDGTNDAPALKMADVGFSMGIAGTEVAKEASAIILMDDNFTSIVKALKWGRAVNDAVKRFLQFQLTVNITAVILTFVTAVSNQEESSVLTAVQLLWVNLIMDTLAALALATDPPQDSVLDRKPERKKSSIISTTMWKMILGQAIYQLLVTFILYYGSANVLPQTVDGTPEEVRDQIQTLVFNTFVWMQIFNQWNNRRLDNKFNIFEGLTHNWFFIGISILMCGGQVLIVMVGGRAFNIASRGQTAAMWGYAIVLGLVSIPVGALIRCVPDSWLVKLVPEWIKRRASRKVPNVTVSDDEERFNYYLAPLADVRDELAFIKRIKGGRLNNLKFAMQHPRETFMPRKSPSHSREHSRSGSAPRLPPQTPTREDSFGSHSGMHTPDSRSRSRSMRSRSNSALGAPTVMAGIVAGSIAAGWSPVDRRGEPDFGHSPKSKSSSVRLGSKAGSPQQASGQTVGEPDMTEELHELAAEEASSGPGVPILGVPKPPKSETKSP